MKTEPADLFGHPVMRRSTSFTRPGAHRIPVDQKPILWRAA